MEKIFFIKNGELKEVNDWLKKGGKVKLIQVVSENVSSYGYTGAGGCPNGDMHGNYVGDIYAYVVIEY